MFYTHPHSWMASVYCIVHSKPHGNLLSCMIHTNSNVLRFQKILPYIVSDVQRLYISMNIFIGFCPTIVWLYHRTCLFKNLALPTGLTPKGYVSEQSHQHMEVLIFLNPWLITDPQNSLHFCQCDRQEIAPHFNLHISVTREVTVHSFFSCFICLLGISVSSVNYMSMFFIHFSVGLFIIFEIVLWKYCMYDRC